ncbi:MAG TPA: ABC transporter permease [Kofleriaceae bacterium]|nr:ABC transporter permease [Kofleriaceae bacterium]
MNELVASIFAFTFLTQVVRITVPYLLAALGGAITERSGTVDLALEGKLLWGAFAAAVFARAADSVAVGIVAAMAAGAAVGAVQALWTVELRADQVVTGVALNLAAYGLSRYLLQLLYGQGSNSPKCPGLPSVWTNPIVIAALAVTVLVIAGVAMTRLGLRVRAAGERPDAVAAAGVSVARTRWAAALLGGAVAGLGGAQLSLPVNGFVAEMSSGRGYVALAAVIMGGWRPAVVAAVCVGFGAAEALQVQLQTSGLGVPTELVRPLPFVLALVLLAVGRGRGHVPSALGRSEP